eukprot:CAMPEP_0179422996 /NCGR_PEP_ID=MMETSP0799-20121207/10755_1 /TAXON_ID=46947 /ORGANISM="Geminigera cryophila, Strain CCMP2564" /LENGTH=55 /DNA_ID=CAMNT_0021197223 /DNA_START=270 /DNA_END=437 /DNA_ORIENTATION=+
MIFYTHDDGIIHGINLEKTHALRLNRALVRQRVDEAVLVEFEPRHGHLEDDADGL